MFLKSTAAKAGGAISGAVGVPAAAVGTYIYVTSPYEVEKKVIEEKVGFEVTGNNNSEKKIQVKTVASSGTPTTGTKWHETEGYWWSCTIKAPSTVTITTNTWQGKLFKDDTTDTTDKEQKLNRNKELVQKCSKGREKGSNSKKVIATLDFSTSTEIKTENDLLKFFFGEEK